MNTNNGPTKGSNVSYDQDSYDLIYNDIIVDSSFGILSNNIYSFNVQTTLNKIYKAELISATVVFNSAIPASVKNKALVLSVRQLNGTTSSIACNQYISTNSNLFCQIPDNCTPLAIANTTISLLVGARVYESIQFYNPPISNLNKLDIQWTDLAGNIISSSSIVSFYFTLRIYHYQKRFITTAFSAPVLNYLK